MVQFMKKSPVAYDDFQKLDLRIGEVKNAVNIEKSKKLIKLAVDFGEDYGVVTILTGMAEFYNPDVFTGKKFVFIANLEPRSMMGEVSYGMILATDETHEDTNKPVLLPVDSSVPNGTTVR